ncbi:alpha/beta fold hydrolase [Halorubrum gandharaense]
MPYANNGDVRLRYEVDGESAAADEAVVFCGDAGFGAWQFGWQHGALAGPHRVITPETRGIGDSDAPPGPYSVEELASDLEAVLRDAGVRTAHLVGYGLGGMVALAHSDRSTRAESLVLLGTAASGDAYNVEGVWADPNDPAAMKATLSALLSADFRERRPEELDRIADWRIAEDAGSEVFAAHRAAVEGFDYAGRLYELTTPALVIHGGEDAVCPPSAGETLAEGLPRGEFEELPDAGHLVGVEASAAVNDLLVGWLAEHASDPFA